jgi:hypothetical protein
MWRAGSSLGGGGRGGARLLFPGIGGLCGCSLLLLLPPGASAASDGLPFGGTREDGFLWLVDGLLFYGSGLQAALLFR